VRDIPAARTEPEENGATWSYGVPWEGDKGKIRCLVANFTLQRPINERWPRFERMELGPKLRN
jgi:hypothetical protein